MTGLDEDLDLDIEAPQTGVCGRCYLYRALNGTCGCD